MPARLNPLTVLAVALVWLAATIVVYRLSFQLGTVALFCGMLLAGRRIGPLKLLVLMVPFALFGFGFLTTNVLFRQDNAAAVAVFSRDLSAGDGLSAGLVLFARALAGGAISLFFALSIDPGGFVRALMATLRLPSAIAYALFAAMQIVPDLRVRLHEYRMARAVREARTLRPLPTPRELAGFLVPLLAYAIRRAGRTAIAMEARGFVPGRPRTLIDVPGFAAADAAFAGAMAAMLAVLVLLTGYG